SRFFRTALNVRSENNSILVASYSKTISADSNDLAERAPRKLCGLQSGSKRGVGGYSGMNAASSYLSASRELLDRLGQTEMPAIEAAAEICAASIAKGGLVFLFGNGHSRMMCEEMT